MKNFFQKIGYEKKCKDVGGTVLVKREADPHYYSPYGLGLGLGPAHLPIHHITAVRQVGYVE